MNIKEYLIIVAVIICSTLTAKGQHLFLIGEQSYPCTERYTLQSDADKWYIDDLDVVFATDGKRAILGASTKTDENFFNDKLIIYLDDASVITLSHRGKRDYVNDIASAVYFLALEDLSKLKMSNIHTIRYTLKDEDGFTGAYGGTFSASNKGRSKYDFPKITTDFFNGELIDIQDPEPEYISEEMAGNPSPPVEGVIGRNVIYRDPGMVRLITEESGKIVLKVCINRKGVVSYVEIDEYRTTIKDKNILRDALESMRKYKYEVDYSAPKEQCGQFSIIVDAFKRNRG